MDGRLLQYIPSLKFLDRGGAEEAEKPGDEKGEG